MDQDQGLNWNKAGLSQANKERTDRIIRGFTEDNPFGEHIKSRRANVNARAQKFQDKAYSITKREIDAATSAFDSNVLSEWQHEAASTPTRWYFLVDMDAYFASVEVKKKPELANESFAVTVQNSVISTSNYKARRYGVRPGLATHIAQALCPGLVLVDPDFEAYKRESEETRKVFAEFDPDFTALSLDEALLDVTDLVEKEFKQRGSDSSNPEDHVNIVEVLASDLRARMFEVTGLTCSVGASTVPLIAKILADHNKPNGQAIIPPGRRAARSYIASLPIRKILGVGSATADLFAQPPFNVKTCKQLIDRRGLIYLIGYPSMLNIIKDAMCLNPSFGFTSNEEAKSIGNERTFAATSSRGLIVAEVIALVDKVWERMVADEVHANLLTMRLKTSSFKNKTKGYDTPEVIDSREKLEKYAIETLDKMLKSIDFVEGGNKISIRLVGVRVSSFVKS